MPASGGEMLMQADGKALMRDDGKAIMAKLIELIDCTICVSGQASANVVVNIADVTAICSAVANAPSVSARVTSGGNGTFTLPFVGQSSADLGGGVTKITCEWRLSTGVGTLTGYDAAACGGSITETEELTCAFRLVKTVTSGVTTSIDAVLVVGAEVIVTDSQFFVDLVNLTTVADFINCVIAQGFTNNIATYGANALSADDGTGTAVSE